MLEPMRKNIGEGGEISSGEDTAKKNWKLGMCVNLHHLREL